MIRYTFIKMEDQETSCSQSGSTWFGKGFSNLVFGLIVNDKILRNFFDQ